ncbi:TSC22 domain family protein 3-like isoform X2 [Amphibalanus amphitrite]|uniref:TSC22 domain family protein 3-like isoform X2 n=1 Tax=Amphibalanus amphitrite TaxID=1232801 RepID=UPI001C913BCF|nr:TSC22 domain family protein 3-like isoform X2 [Amphibalanus amphitrite]XP_043235790.1 TSC22 domain family protein 3-like isoform X2 [Amphibalanus amphitrite]
MVGWSVHRRLDRILCVSSCLLAAPAPAPASEAAMARPVRTDASASPGGSSLDNKIEPIDNKIEQAMDLVKSHLLLAVREEVDVLKANITKLVDKISVLERENEVLKTNASPEVLAKLAERPAAPPAAGQSAPGHRVA